MLLNNKSAALPRFNLKAELALCTKDICNKYTESTLTINNYVWKIIS